MKKGVTLIELLVVLGVFSLFIGGAINIFVFATKAQARTLATQQLLEQINFVLEYMGREIRMAKKDDVSVGNRWPYRDCCLGNKVNFEIREITSGSGVVQFLLFRDSRNNCHSFSLSNYQIVERIGATYNEIIFGPPRPLTATSSVIIRNLRFRINGAENNSFRQPQVTIMIEAQLPNDPSLVLRFQTTISQRDLNIEM